MLPTFVGVTLLAFTMIRLIPGDPVELLVGERGMTAERHAELRANLGKRKAQARARAGGAVGDDGEATVNPDAPKDDPGDRS